MYSYVDNSPDAAHLHFPLGPRIREIEIALVQGYSRFSWIDACNTCRYTIVQYKHLIHQRVDWKYIVLYGVLPLLVFYFVVLCIIATLEK